MLTHLSLGAQRLPPTPPPEKIERMLPTPTAVRSERLHAIWRSVSQSTCPFVLPESICAHPPSHWQTYDANQAGCLLCGALHICRDHETCTTVENDEGHLICNITGCCVRNISFHANEYLDHVHSVPGEVANTKLTPVPDSASAPNTSYPSPRARASPNNALSTRANGLQPRITKVNKKNRYRCVHRLHSSVPVFKKT